MKKSENQEVAVLESVAKESKSVAKKSENKAKKVTEPSNKRKIYDAWVKGQEDHTKLNAIVKDAVKSQTIKNWVNRWRKGNALPKGVPAK